MRIYGFFEVDFGPGGILDNKLLKAPEVVVKLHFSRHYELAELSHFKELAGRLHIDLLDRR